MFKKVRQNRRRDPQISQIDRKGWMSLAGVILKVALTCAIAAGIPYGIYRYYQHLVDEDYFLPRQIDVKGNVRVDDQSILDASGLQIENANLFETNVHTVEASIETLSWVKTAKVKVELPDTVHIEIEEHQPLGLVNDGQLNIVDAEGNYIKTWATDDPIMAPIVSVDKPLDKSADHVVQAFELAETVAKYGYPDKIQEIHYDDATGYTLFTQSTEIRLGYDRFDERIERLITVNQVLENKKIVAAYILLDADNSLDRIVVKPKPKYVAAPPAENAENKEENTDNKNP